MFKKDVRATKTLMHLLVHMVVIATSIEMNREARDFNTYTECSSVLCEDTVTLLYLYITS